MTLKLVAIVMARGVKGQNKRGRIEHASGRDGVSYPHAPCALVFSPFPPLRTAVTQAIEAECWKSYFFAAKCKQYTEQNFSLRYQMQCAFEQTKFSDRSPFFNKKLLSVAVLYVRSTKHPYFSVPIACCAWVSVCL